MYTPSLFIFNSLHFHTFNQFKHFVLGFCQGFYHIYLALPDQGKTGHEQGTAVATSQKFGMLDFLFMCVQIFLNVCSVFFFDALFVH